ncbi:MAG: penicillin-binding protein 1C [Sandaracinaceae bacterium]|nr:penicillin-binding protein 1C [Sandaracinaceae bacterium]
MTRFPSLSLRFPRAPRRALALAVFASVVLHAASQPFALAQLSSTERTSTQILDRNGRLLDERLSALDGYGRPVPLNEISPYLVAATLAGEDQNFYLHPGVDPVGLGRALWLDLRAGRFAYGGSTLTQQLAKTFNREPRTLVGKIREAIAALRLERTLGKAGILEAYLNRVYYGRNAYGVEAAAQRFFGRSARELTLDQASLLAVLPRAPTRYDPSRHPAASLARRAHLLDIMVRARYGSRAEANAAAAQPLALASTESGREAPHLLDWLTLHGSIPEGESRASTTIDLDLQTRIEERVRTELVTLRARGISQASVVVIDNRSMDVLALVGSAAYEATRDSGAVNGAMAVRRPGSTLKPFLYAMAIENGDFPGTPVVDVPTMFRGYTPHSLDARYHGVVPMREALASSLNVPATRLAAELGPSRFAQLLERAGFASALHGREPGVTIALGGVPTRLIEIAEAYAMLANGGVHRDARLLRDLNTANEPGQRIFSEETAYLVTSMLSDSAARRREFGYETPLDLPFPLAAKTGTSQAYADDLVAGYTPELTVAVWTGNFDGSSTDHMLAMQGAAPLFAEVMQTAMRGRPARDFTQPAGVARIDVCPISGMLPGPHCGSHVHELVARSAAPHEQCTWHTSDGVSLPAEVQAFSPTPNARALDEGRAPLRILAPANESRFVRDPSLPAASQGLVLRAALGAPHVARVHWTDNGQPIGEPSAPFSQVWMLSPGVHRLRATGVSDGVSLSDEVTVYVDGERG